MTCENLRAREGKPDSSTPTAITNSDIATGSMTKTQQTPAVCMGGVEREEAMPHTVECVSEKRGETKSEDSRISCFVKTYNGTYLCLDVSLSDGVSAVKELVQAKCGVEPQKQRLTYVWLHCRRRRNASLLTSAPYPCHIIHRWHILLPTRTYTTITTITTPHLSVSAGTVGASSSRLGRYAITTCRRMPQ